MEKKLILLVVIGVIVFAGCRRNKLDPKGFPVSTEADEDAEEKITGISKDSLGMKTRPGTVLLTGWPTYRLTALFKINYTKKKKRPFIGSIAHHRNYSRAGNNRGNQWNNNFLPGLDAAYGYNLVNISLNHLDSGVRKEFFETPVLIKTLYYPAFSKDTLNYEPVNRNYYLVSAYNDDTNNDGYINVRDLRRFFWFDIDGNMQGKLLPDEYSVMRSEYDSGNDLLYVYAREDENSNGRQDSDEGIHVFWVDLKDPGKNGKLY